MTENNRPSNASEPHSSAWRLEKHISSDPCQGVAVIREVLRQLESQQWGESDAFGIHLSLEEAMANAIHHGNCRDPNKCVRIHVEMTDESFYAKISDDGCGFDPAQVPDPTAYENLDRPNGRGLKLMRCYMDNVVYNPVGNSVELFKKRTARPAIS